MSDRGVYFWRPEWCGIDRLVVQSLNTIANYVEFIENNFWEAANEVDTEIVFVA